MQWGDGESIASRQPLRVILASRLRLPEKAPLLDHPGPILLVHAGAEEAGTWPAHVETLALPGPNQRIDLQALLTELARRECNEVLVEAGAVLAGALDRKSVV